MRPKTWWASSLILLAAACAEAPDASRRDTPVFDVTVSAYCLEGKTASGRSVRTGVAAADPDVLPMGSLVRLRGDATQPALREGVYTILDTGGKIQGRRIDVYIPSCSQAVRFGRRTMVAEVLRYGWAQER